jgi:antitoxin component of MazEF toxin-antitoxin module
MVRLARLTRNGNSVSVSIPPAFLRELQLHRGDTVALGVDAGRLVARKVSDQELMPPAPAETAFVAGRKRKR